MPVPLTGIAVVEAAALLEIEMLPVVLPADVGANTTLNVVLPPAAIVVGVDIPLTVKPLPEAEIEAMLRLAVPVFITITDSEELLPVVTLPKETLVGDVEIAGSAA